MQEDFSPGPEPRNGMEALLNLCCRPGALRGGLRECYPAVRLRGAW